MATYTLRQNDALIPMVATLSNADGTAIDLSGVSAVEFHVGYEGDIASKLVEAAASVTDGENGEVTFTWTASYTDLDVGTYDAEFECTWPNGMIRTVPTKSGQLKVVVVGEVA